MFYEMKAKEIIEILSEHPEANVTISLSSDKLQCFAESIMEITTQGEKQFTIVADINENYSISHVSMPKGTLCQTPESCKTSYYQQIGDYYCSKCKKTGLA